METGATVFRDIHGLDAIPWWPLATGWWYVAGLVGLLLLFIGIRHWLFYYTGWLGWRGDARRQLRYLKASLPSEDPHALAGRLSELLRRIALAHTEYREAAGLTGDSWLRWLVEHDNAGFDWEQHGQVLLTAPYMPPTMMNVERDELASLIKAATRWVNAYRTTDTETGLSKRLKGLLSGSLRKDGVSRV